MTLTREPVPSPEQVIAWVKNERATWVKCRTYDKASGFVFEVAEADKAIAHLEAILTLLQSAETVAQERDRYKREASEYEELEARICPEDRGFEEVINLLRKERDRLTQEVYHLRGLLDAKRMGS